MPLRVRTYYDDFQMELWRGKRFGATSRLQPALTIVVHAGQSKWRAKQGVASLVEPGPWDAEQGDGDAAVLTGSLFAGDGYLLLDSAQLKADDGHEHNAAWLLAAFENPSPAHLTTWVSALHKRLAAPELKALLESILRWADWVVWQRTGFEMGVSDMAQVNALQTDGELEGYMEARRRAWMEDYHEERRQEGREEGREEVAQNPRLLLAALATNRFGRQIGQRLTELVTDAEEKTRFDQVCQLMIDSADGEEFLRGVKAKFT